jgi:hypothetical protein
MIRRRERLLAVITVLGSFALCLGIAEAVLRFLPVATGMRMVSVTAASPVAHFTPNRDFLFSRDWNLALVNRGHVNNAGFVNDQDYQREKESPLVAVVGDSYIEAAMVPFGETMHGRLAAALDGRLRVYSFGAAGAPLSQYLAWARHVISEYGAGAIVINVVGNDFDESLTAYGRKPAFWQYAPDETGALRLRLSEYRRGIASDLVTASALGRYLVFNLQVGAQLLALRSLFLGPPAAAPEYAGNTAAGADTARVKDSLIAIDAFFRDLSDLVRLPPERVLLTIDGFRYPQAADRGAGSYFDQMRRAFRAKAEALGYEIIDLDAAFFARHRKTGERFEHPTDGHWNARGHEVAFEAVMSSRLLKSMAHSAERGAGGKVGSHVE